MSYFVLDVLQYDNIIHAFLIVWQADDNQDVNLSNALNGYPGWVKKQKPDTYNIKYYIRYNTGICLRVTGYQ